MPNNYTQQQNDSHGANPSPLAQTLAELSEVSTVHGLRYALSCKSRLVDRAFWAVIVIGAFALSIYMSVQIYLNWKASPVVTTIGTNALPITDLDFPAITLCRYLHVYIVVVSFVRSTETDVLV